MYNGRTREPANRRALDPKREVGQRNLSSRVADLSPSLTAATETSKEIQGGAPATCAPYFGGGGIMSKFGMSVAVTSQAGLSLT